MKSSPWLPKSIKINERYERFRVMLRYIFTDLDVEDWKFFYFPIQHSKGRLR
ncbi:Imm41 family immunity protein [Neisseria meningitidis]|uniref:Imm41 family immunity protein n=1 Tax=Neisseria meningitidis TaxID=487 RepID=UPI00397F03C4